MAEGTMPDTDRGFTRWLEGRMGALPTDRWGVVSEWYLRHMGEGGMIHSSLLSDGSMRLESPDGRVLRFDGRELVLLSEGRLALLWVLLEGVKRG